MRSYLRFKKILTWTLMLTIFLANIALLFSQPKTAKAAFNFTGSTFTARPDGTLLHTYTVNGQAKEMLYINQRADTGPDFFTNGSGSSNPLYVYEMSGSATHPNWGKNCMKDAIISPKQSKYYLVIYKDNDNFYKVKGIYFQSQCTNATACASDSTRILEKEYYFRTQDFGNTGEDCEDVYATDSEFYGYLTYVNSRSFGTVGFTTGETSKECTISGKVQVDFSTQNLTGAETGIVQWPDIKKKGYLGDFVFKVELWYKGQGSAAFISASETTDIKEDGTYTFEKKARPVGQYVVTWTLKRTANSPSFQPGTIDPSFENQSLNLIDPSYYPAFSDQGEMEYFFGKSAPFDIGKDCSDITGKDITAASIGIKEKKGSEGDLIESCGVTGSWVTEAIASVLCSFINGIAALADWLTNALFQGVFNA